MKKPGFTLVELMTAMAIAAVLAGVAIPAYFNYRNRALQTEAVEAVLRAKMDQEVFRAEHNRYASTIGCLASFGDTCSRTVFLTPGAYTVAVVSAGASTFRVRAKKTYSTSAQADTVAITESSPKPIIGSGDALKFSLFKWVFD